MLHAKRCIQWCIIGLLALSPDLFSASGFISSDGVFGCSSGDDFLDGGERTFDFDFTEGTQGWQGGFADYPLGQEVFYELIFDYRPLLPDLDPNDNGLFVSGHNHSDDLFMFVKRRVDGLAPNQIYLVDFAIEIGSEAGSDCVGIGGSPAITLKAGATQIEPTAIADFSGFLRMNIDKGNQSTSGANALVLGDTGVDVDCNEPVFESKRLETPANVSFEMTTDDNGAAWLIVGTDSGFEGVTRLFYTHIGARFASR
jgi:hypothetical protein